MSFCRQGPSISSRRTSPRPGGGLDWAETSLETPHGPASVPWEVEGDSLHVTVDVPDGTEAVLQLPGPDDEILAPGRHTRRGVRPGQLLQPGHPLQEEKV
jgi:alpha-L-rhamnosidase